MKMIYLMCLFVCVLSQVFADTDPKCEHEGQTYGHEEKWSVGCSLVCTCMVKDGKAYEGCTTMCAPRQLMLGCWFEANPEKDVATSSKCCDIVKCHPECKEGDTVIPELSIMFIGDKQCACHMGIKTCELLINQPPMP